MNKRFSERNGLVPEKEIQLLSMDTALFNRLWNVFYQRECIPDSIYIIDDSNGIGTPESIMDTMGWTFAFPNSHYDVNKNIETIRKNLQQSQWYATYDFIEKYIMHFSKVSEKKAIETEYNEVLEEEKSGYRVLKGLVIPITNKTEIESLSKSLSTPFTAVSIHMKRLYNYIQKDRILIMKIQ